MRLFLMGLLVSLNAFAVDWTELSAGQKYSLRQSFQLPQVERSGSLLDFSKGELFLLKEVVPLSIPGAELVLYVFDYKNCSGPEMKTEMEIIPVEGSFPLVEAGAQVEECELNIFIEGKDYFSQSLFE